MCLKAASVARGHPVKVHDFTQNAEGTSGADIELWVATKGGRALGYSLQAKRLETRGSQKVYRKLNERSSSGT
jgi:hypothetical protein